MGCGLGEASTSCIECTSGEQNGAKEESIQDIGDDAGPVFKRTVNRKGRLNYYPLKEMMFESR